MTMNLTFYVMILSLSTVSHGVAGSTSRDNGSETYHGWLVASGGCLEVLELSLTP